MAMGKTWRWRGRCVLLLALAAGGWLAAEAQAQEFSWPEGRKAAVSLSYDDALDSQLDNAIPALKVDRGGQVTYHGPGQLVVYVLVDLKRRRLGVRELVRRLEAAVVEWLGSSGISAYGKPSAPGVYVSRDGVEAKIAALGLKVRNGCTYHGIAVNVAMDLSPFADIDPCGFPGLAVTQLADLGVAMTVERAGQTLAPILAATIAERRP